MLWIRIRDPVLFGPWTRDPGWRKFQSQDPGSGMNIPDLICENLVLVFGLKIHKLFDADPDPGSGILSTLVLYPGWKKSAPGSWILDPG